jgi:hypothetical protein
MEPAPGSVTVTMSGATFPGGQGAVGWGRSRQGLAPPVLLGPPADAALAPLAASPRQNGGRGQRRDHRHARPAGGAGWFRRARRGVGPRLRTLVIGLALDPDRVVLASQLIDAVLDGTAGGGDQRAWPTDTWAKVGVDPQATARAVIGGWERGDLPGLQLGGLTAEEALALERPAMCASSSASGLPAAPAGLAAVAAPHQRTPGRRPLPVAADMPWPQCPRRTPADRTPSQLRQHPRTPWTPPQPSGWPHPDTVAGCGG